MTEWCGVMTGREKVPDHYLQSSNERANKATGVLDILINHLKITNNTGLTG